MIIAHSKSPKNFKVLENATHLSHGKNPLCGDDFFIYLSVQDNIINDLGFMGQGCAISKASGSLMTATIKGKSLEEAIHLKDAFIEMLVDSLNPKNKDLLGKLTVFEGVKEYPVRVKCATLVWRAIEAALSSNQSDDSVASISTE